MDRSLLLLSFLLLAAAVGHAALSPQLYWHSVLPNTPMPKAISNLLSPGALADKKAGTSVSVGKGGVYVNTGKGKPGGTTVGVGRGGVGVHVSPGKGRPGGTTVGVGHGGVSVNTRYPNKKKPVVVNVKPGNSPFIYNYAATETQLHDDPNVALFFLEKDLRPGAKMNLHFTQTTSSATFLPRQAAESIPFSSAKLPVILHQLSIESDSVQAEAMRNTLKECEEPALGGEKKHCVTSLESMVEFSTSTLGTHDVRATSTTVDKEGTPAQQYTIRASGVRRMAGTELVACHPQAYPYAVFYCHATTAARAYTVEMVGKDGTKVEAVAVCHTDTKAWNPKHLAFQVLKVKPGTVPVCHFLPQDHVVWSRSS
ncbi:BURP domain-containing protein 3 [Cocos nucifera]|uniref:BURP domain-containing protein 3 n=1 Tax=Cocos nucifera TaxID=13894 RepID=A0A8K0NBR9_COCNU|nr:BURP domain-containing protein 3 [Cocos nucifera]